MSPPLTERAVNLPSNNSPPKPRMEEMQSPIANSGMMNGGFQQQGQGQGQRGIQTSESMDSVMSSPSDNGAIPQASVQQSPRQMEGMQQQPQQQQQFQQLQHQPEPTDLAAPIRPAQQPQQQQQPQANGPPQTNGPPQRPRREGDEEYRRAMSPPNLPPSPTNPTHRVVSPTNAKNGFNSSILGTRSPSPRMRMLDRDPDTGRPVPPADAFYYGRSPTTNGFSPKVRPNSLQGSGSSELMNQLKSRDAELEAGRKREAGLRVILKKAMQSGFVAEYEDEDEKSEDGEDDDDLIGKLTDALVRLKHEKASIQVSS